MGKKILKGVLIGLLVLALIFGGLMTFVLLGKEKVMGTEIGTIDLSSVADGVYEGSFSGYRWSNEVKVSVKDHQIIEVEVIKAQIFAKPETINKLTEEVIGAQSLQVDSVSSATADSKAFLKAIENALS
ncbi:MAG: FMN-binding protein [Firmicutes bacterium HGW-Firmicutes-16]|nr:MAG: FMN-binding protein [Firmicutes bacterium HGW-Firmicutes-16]